MLARGPEQAGELQTSATSARFDRISTADGLPDEVVYAILQDRQGFMWFGTSKGLARYDGYQFVLYQNDPTDPKTLSHDTVRSIIQDRNGDLWIGTGHGVDRLDVSTGAFSHYLSGRDILSLCEDEESFLWVGTNYGATRINLTALDPMVFFRGSASQGLPAKSASYPLGDIFHAIYQDQAGEIWLASGPGSSIRLGLDRFDRQSGTFVHYGYDPADSTSLSNGDACAIFQDRQGNFWVGTDGGLNRLHRSSTGFTRYQHNPDNPNSLAADRVNAVFEDSAGRLWVGTVSGLDQLDRSQGRFIHYLHDPTDPKSLGGNTILTIYEDRSGVVWFGTTTGVSRYDETASQFALVQNRSESRYRLSDNAIRAVPEDRDGNLWIGTASGGLNRLDRSTGTVQVYRHDPADPASLSSDGLAALFEDHAGNLWVGTDSHWLERFDPITGEFVQFWYASAGEPQVLAEDRAGNLWIGTPNGLYRLDLATKAFTHFRTTMAPALSANRVTSLRVLQDGKVLVGTDGGGVDVWDPVVQQFTSYRHNPADPNSLAHDSVYAIYGDPAGQVIWIGTSRGLDRLELATGTVTHYSEEDGLAGRAVVGIEADADGNLWIATDQGLSQITPRTGTFRTYSARDGFPTDRIVRNAMLQGVQGEMVIGSSDGLVAFYPGTMPENPHAPPIVVTVLSVFDEVIRRNVPSGEPIRLSYEQNFLSFEYVALDFTAPEMNRYAYRLEGLDPAWVQAGSRRRADYPNLAPGTYVFRVKGSNDAGVWNEDGIAIPITITPPFWGTRWFQLLSLLALLGALFVPYEWRVRSIRVRSRELQAQVADRTAELTAANALLEQEIAERKRTQEALAQERAAKAVVAERNRLARELHDSATQSLYAVTLYADTATRQLTMGQLEPAAENLLKLRGTAKEALGEMRMLIFELHPPILVQQGLAAALEARLEAVEGRAGLQTEFRVEGDARLPVDDEEGLYRIAVEALNNVLRHAHARRISVSLHFQPEATRLEVVDDGIGCDPAIARKQGGLGLAGMAERAQQMEGTLSVESAPGTGTRRRVVVPRMLE